MSTGIIRVGVSGWTFAQWRGVFYPKSLKREEELGFAANRFRTLEINDTFYGLLRPEMFRDWAEQVSAEFAFTVRGPQLITHRLRLQNVTVPLANFFASGLLRLGLHLGPILWQFPANFRFDPTRLEAFLHLLPRSTEAALALARKHDKTLRAPPWLEVDAQRIVRHAFEVRHSSFRCHAFIDMLRAHDVAVVCADSPAFPRLMGLTSDFVYCRLHGPETPSAAGYDNATLDTWVKRLRTWALGGEPSDAERVSGKARPRRRDVYVYFDNAQKLRAPANALELIRRLRS